MKHLHQNLGEVTGYWCKGFILTCPCDQPCRMDEAFVSEFRRGGGDIGANASSLPVRGTNSRSQFIFQMTPIWLISNLRQFGVVSLMPPLAQQL